MTTRCGIKFVINIWKHKYKQLHVLDMSSQFFQALHTHTLLMQTSNVCNAGLFLEPFTPTPQHFKISSRQAAKVYTVLQ